MEYLLHILVLVGIYTILAISMVIIGGTGSPWGPLIGAVVLVTIPKALRVVALRSLVGANLKQIF